MTERGKRKGGGLAVFVNDRWCMVMVMVSSLLLQLYLSVLHPANIQPNMSPSTLETIKC